MKKDGKYRFSLQFNSETEEQFRAGELLERMGNRKSHLVVAALNEYMESHPELKSKDCKGLIVNRIKQAMTMATIEPTTGITAETPHITAIRIAYGILKTIIKR